MHTEKMEYHDGETVLEAFVAYEKQSHNAPCVLVLPAWSGRDAFADNKAKELASLGYVGCALDVYGKGIVGDGPETNARLMKPFMEDRAVLQKRLLSGFEAAKHISGVNPQKIAAIGFCFGGLCVLDMARSGADLKGVVSFHGLFDAPPLPKKPIRAKILVLHGHDDPMAPPSAVADFENEMTEAAVDWQVHIYGGVMHAFANPAANNPAFGTLYNPVAARRSWIAMQNFLQEVFE